MVADFSLLNSSEILITSFCASRRRVSNKRVTCQNFKLKLNSPTSNSCRMIVYRIPGAAQFFHATLKNILVCCLDIQMRNRRNQTCLSNLSNLCSFSYFLVKRVQLQQQRFPYSVTILCRKNCRENELIVAATRNNFSFGLRIWFWWEFRGHCHRNPQEDASI